MPMGLVYAVMEIGDPTGERFVPFRGLVDTGALFTTLPARMLASLGVSPTATGAFELADGRSIERGYTVATLRYGGEKVIAPVVFDESDSQLLIGASALELLGLIVDPVNSRLAPVNLLLGQSG